MGNVKRLLAFLIYLNFNLTQLRSKFLRLASKYYILETKYIQSLSQKY